MSISTAVVVDANASEASTELSDSFEKPSQTSSEHMDGYHSFSHAPRYRYA
ncbi:MAG: hypothetical protein ACFFD4_22475 [Candidatus Odinarchaeota archaeon]